MPNNDLKQFEDDLDFFDFTLIYWQNKWLVVAVIVLTVFLGAVFYYSTSLLSTYLSSDSEETTTSINILVNEALIEEVNTRVNANFTYDAKNTIVLKLNKLIKSAFNYENWSEDTKDLSPFLPQGMTSSMVVLYETHVVNVLSSSEKNLEAVISYLNYTSALISQNERQRLETQINVKKDDLFKQNKKYEDRLVGIRDDYEYKLLSIDDEISSRTIQLEGAKKEFEVFADDIPKETQDSSLLTLRMLDLTNTIQIQELMIEDLKTRKEVYIDNFSTRIDYYNTLITTLEFDSSAELSKVESLKDDVAIVAVGNIVSSKNAYFQPNKFIIFSVSIVIGLLLGFGAVVFKVELLKRKRNREILK